MSGRKFNTGLLVGVFLTIGVLLIVGLLTLNAKAALQGASYEVGAGGKISSSGGNLPQLGEVSFKGLLETITADTYVVSGVTFRFDAQTLVASGLQVGDLVEVKALLLPDQTRYVLSIELENSFASSSQPEFKFYGIVESTGSTSWVISGETVQMDGSTTIDTGVDLGSLVEVEGFIVNGSLLASKIQIEDLPGTEDGSDSSTDEVEFYGAIESIANDVYVIDGKTVMTDSSTEIKGSLAVGDFVKVHATLESDGTTYLAREIEKEEDTSNMGENFSKKIEFTGMVESINGNVWVVGGYTITVGDLTEVKGNPQVGNQVKVEATLQSDGVTYLAHEIKLLDDNALSGDKSKHDSDDDDSNDDSQDDDHDDDKDDDHSDDKDDDSDKDDHDKDRGMFIQMIYRA